MQIEDGGGTGRVAKVNSDGRLITTSVVASLEHHANHQGNAFNAIFEQTPDGVDSCIFYLKNTSEVDIVAEGITLSVSAACNLRVERSNAGTPVGATDITPVNLNGGSGHEANGVFQHGGDLGLNSSSVIEMYRFMEDTCSKHYNFHQDLILPKNRAMTIWCLTLDGSGDIPIVYATVSFHYHDAEIDF